jgi:hypothetical protein
MTDKNVIDLGHVDRKPAQLNLCPFPTIN